MYQNRADAGRQLSGQLLSYKDGHVAVVALPRGGVPVAFEVARALSAPLDVMVVRKLGFPGQPELAIGAIVDGKRPEILLNRGLFTDRDLPPRYLDQEIHRRLEEIDEMKATLAGHRPALALSGRNVIVVDDGIATGATVRVVIRRIRQGQPARVIVATPVAAREAVEVLRREADEVVCPLVPDFFGAVGSFYADFRAVTDEEVRRLLDESLRRVP